MRRLPFDLQHGLPVCCQPFPCYQPTPFTENVWFASHRTVPIRPDETPSLRPLHATRRESNLKKRFRAHKSVAHSGDSAGTSDRGTPAAGSAGASANLQEGMVHNKTRRACILLSRPSRTDASVAVPTERAQTVDDRDDGHEHGGYDSPVPPLDNTAQVNAFPSCSNLEGRVLCGPRTHCGSSPAGVV